MSITWRAAGGEFLLFCVVTALFVLAQGPFAFRALYIKDVLHAGDGLYGKLGFLTMASSLVFAFLLGRPATASGIGGRSWRASVSTR